MSTHGQATKTAEVKPARSDTATPASLVDHRAADRVQRILSAKLHGRQGILAGMVVNLSRTGALVTITDKRWNATPEDDDMGLVGLRIAAHFGEGLRIEFEEAGFTQEAEVVRITEGKIGSDFASYVGIRFLPKLTDKQCASVGLNAAEAPAPKAPARPSGPRVEGVEGTDGVVVVQAAPGGLQAIRPLEPQEPASVRIDDGASPVSMHDLLRKLVEHKATDLHLKGGSPVRMRVDGTMLNMGNRDLSPEDARAFVRELLEPEQFQRFEEDHDLDMAHSIRGLARFRVNVHRSQGEMGLAIRRIPEEVPDVKQLGLASVCMAIADRPRGLVLVTGPTGSGKSTTLAAMIHHINTTRACHIVTMEDPIEYSHREVKAHLTQREIGRDTKDFKAALRRALRQDPDVILVGEMRDLETIGLAVTAAETGHLVFGTLHTTSAPLTVDRIVDVFPPVQQRQIRMQLADSLQGIFSQVLLPRIRGGMIVAQEILVATSGVRALIREGKAPQIMNMMQTGCRYGMQTLEDSLNDLVARSEISYETAVAKANISTLIKKAGTLLDRD
ncbi:MAG: type IV pilus twitching motility protein PilT [Planctomycetota bacterium]|jgi:twitching motility protein PilT